ncbi:MAG: hypothetical protein PHQ81_08285, partial [Methanofollis sp.]|nr:hypothetical protein [Methanofollis sp.]
MKKLGSLHCHPSHQSVRKKAGEFGDDLILKPRGGEEFYRSYEKSFVKILLMRLSGGCKVRRSHPPRTVRSSLPPYPKAPNTSRHEISV